MLNHTYQRLHHQMWLGTMGCGIHCRGGAQLGAAASPALVTRGGTNQSATHTTHAPPCDLLVHDTGKALA